MKYLDKMDAEENETSEPVKEDEEKDDPGSDMPFTTKKGHSSVAAEGIVDVHRDEESDTYDQETENMRIGQSDRFWMVRVDELDDVDDDGEEEEEQKKDNSSGKIEEEVGEDDELVEAHEVASSYDEDDVVEYDEEELDNEEQDLGSASNKEQVTLTEGEIDGHDQGDDEDDNGETGKKDIGEVGYEVKDWAEEDDDEEEENGSGYLVQPAIQPLGIADDNGDVSRDSDIKPVNDEENEEENGNDDLDEDVEDDMEHDHQVAQFRTAPSSSSHFKRKRSDEDDKDEDMADSDKEG